MRQFKTAIGIDPGTKGGITVISDKREIEILRLSRASYSEICNFLKYYIESGPCIVAIEQVGERPGEGVTSVKKFAYAAGFLYGAALAQDVHVQFVIPQVWQRALSLGGSYPDKTARKNAQKEKAKALFPELGKITLEEADSILIAYYAWCLHVRVKSV